MKITTLRVKIQPWNLRDGMKELRVEVFVDGTMHTYSTPFDDDDFGSLFDRLMEQCRREILRYVREHGDKRPNATPSATPNTEARHGS